MPAMAFNLRGVEKKPSDLIKSSPKIALTIGAVGDRKWESELQCVRLLGSIVVAANKVSADQLCDRLIKGLCHRRLLKWSVDEIFWSFPLWPFIYTRCSTIVYFFFCIQKYIAIQFIYAYLPITFRNFSITAYRMSMTGFLQCNKQSNLGNLVKCKL